MEAQKRRPQRSGGRLGTGAAGFLAGLALLTAGCSSRAATLASPSPAPELLTLGDQVGGSYTPLARSGDDIVMGWGPRVALFQGWPDGASARQPLLSRILPGVVRQVAAQGNTILAGVHNHGVVALDSAAIAGGDYATLLSMPDPRALTVLGGIGLVVDGASGEIVSFRAAPGGGPAELSRYALDDPWASGRRVQPEILVAGDGGAYVSYLDEHLESLVAWLEVGEDGRLSRRGSFALMQPIADLTVHERLVYAVERYTSIHVVQFDEAGVARELGSFGRSADPARFPAFVAAGDGGVAIVYNPYSAQASPPELAVFPSNSPWSAEPRRLSLAPGPIVGDVVFTDGFVTALRVGLTAIEAAPDQKLTLFTALPLLGSVSHTVATAEHVLILDTSSRVWCLPEGEARAGNWAGLLPIEALASTGDIAATEATLLTANVSQGLQLWSVGPGCTATRLSALSTAPLVLQSVRSFGTQAVGVATRHVRGDERQELMLFDVADPSRPVQLQEMAVDLERMGWLSYTALDLGDSVLAIAGRDKGMYFYDLADSSGKEWSFEANESIGGVAWAPERRLYYLGASSIQSADVESVQRPLSRQKRTADPLPGGLDRLESGVLLAETDWDSKSRVVRLLDPDTLEELGTVDVPDGRQPSVRLDRWRGGSLLSAQDVGLVLLRTEPKPSASPSLLPLVLTTNRHTASAGR